MPSLNLSTRFSRPRSASAREQPPVPFMSPMSLEQAGPSSHSVTNGHMAKGFKEAEYSDEGGDELILSKSNPLRQSSTALGSEPQSPMIRGSSPPRRSFSFARPRRSHTVKATSVPHPTAMPETGSRSLLSRGRNSMLSKAILNNPPPRVVSAPTISQSPGSPRGCPHSVLADDDRELDMLREAAARSIGIASTDGNSPPNRVSFGDSSGEARAVRQRNGPVRFQEPSVRSESPSINSEPVPPFPCALSSLQHHIRYTSAVSKYCAPPPFVSFLGPNKGSTRHWKSRHLVLTSVTYPATNSTPEEQVYVRTDYLHIFKGSFPNDKEVDRLLLTDHSAAILPNERDLGDRQCVVRVNGHNAKGIKQDERGTLILQGEAVWYFQCPDIQTMQKWLVSIRDAILNYRYWRADPTKRRGAPTAAMTVRSRLERALTPDVLGGDCVTTDDESQTVPVFRPHTSLGIRTNTSKPRGLRGLFINTQHNHSSLPTPGASRTVSPSRPEVSSISSSPNPPSPSAEGTRLSLTGSTPEVSQDLSLTSVDEASVSFSFEGVPHTKPRVITPISTSGSLAIMAREGRVSSESTPKDTVITVSKPGTPNSTTEAQVVSAAVPARLLVGVPITPAEERPVDPSLGMNGAKRNRLMNPRTFSPSTNPIEGDREREDFQRFLASPSYNPSILGPSLLLGMTQAASLSLPPPPRSRRATTSGGLLHPSTGGDRASPSLVQSRSRGSLDMSPAADASDLGKTSSMGRADGEGRIPDPCVGPVDFNMSPRSARLLPSGIDDNSPRSGTGGDQFLRNASDSNDTSIPDALHHHRRNSGQDNRPRHSSSPSMRRNRLGSLPKMTPPPQRPTPEVLVTTGDTVVYNPSNGSIPPWRQTQISPVTRLRSLSQSTKTGTYFARGRDSIGMSSSHSVHSLQSQTTHISNEGSITPISTSPAQSYPSPYIHPDAITSSHSFGIRERDNSSVSLAGDQGDQSYGSSSPGGGMIFRRPNYASLHSGSSSNKSDVSVFRARAASIPALTGSRTSHDSFPSFTPFWSTTESGRTLPPNSTSSLSYVATSPPPSALREDEDFSDLSPTCPELPTSEANSPPSLPQFLSHPFPPVQFPYDRIDINEVSDGPLRSHRT